MSLHCIKQLIHRKKIGNACRFGKNTTIDSKAYFEGMNRLGENTWFLNSSIGYASYISNNSFIKNTVIGRYTCIANDVMTVAGNHPTSFVSIHPAFYSLAQKPSYVKQSKFEDFKYLNSEKKISIEIGNDVWIGANTIVLGGVKIGNGSVIGAGSVVVKDIPDNVIAFGNPCKVIRDITDEDKKKCLDWNKK